MIVYANRQREADCGELLFAVRSAVEWLQAVEPPDHERAIELLVAFGDLETAVVDAVASEVDRDSDLTRSLRQTSHWLGRLVHRTWRRDVRRARYFRNAVAAAVEALSDAGLPRRVSPRVPEGYVYYSLRPEMYLEAAQRFAAEVGPRRAVCIGLRSIGTSLSAVVAATLLECGCDVRSFTVRPHGHPFDRVLVLSPELDGELRAAVRDAHVLVVDEGPGLSGSSFTAVLRWLAAAGVADERVSLFPSWQPDPERFVSGEARRRWRRHRSWLVPFEDVWLRTGRLARAFSASALTDLSAGRWRSLLYPSAAEHPAVHPHHERRKYLSLVPTDGEPRLQLLKFCGLGAYGRAGLARSESLAAAGFAPRPRKLRHGFLAMDFLRGRPLTAADASPPFLERAADYVALLAHRDTRTEPVPLGPIEEMMDANVGEALGADWQRALGRLEESRAAVAQGRAIAVDGRMLPHEWLATDGRYVKTDGIDHHDDHSFPGRQDVAWDVAGLAVEFELEPAAERSFVEGCRARLGDPQLVGRLPFYRAAYLAYRIGYCSVAAASVEDSEDRARFEALRERYAADLKGVLARERSAREGTVAAALRPAP